MAIDLVKVSCLEKSCTDKGVTIDPEAANETFIVVSIDLSGFKDFGEARLSPASFNRLYSQARRAVHRNFIGCFEIFLITKRFEFCVSVSGYGGRYSALIVLKTIERVFRIWEIHFACTRILTMR
jgi:hypothetical protein